eukprot:219762-Chlamydomonas_euryale.AAC.1
MYVGAACPVDQLSGLITVRFFARVHACSEGARLQKMGRAGQETWGGTREGHLLAWHGRALAWHGGRVLLGSCLHAWWTCAVLGSVYMPCMTAIAAQFADIAPARPA